MKLTNITPKGLLCPAGGCPAVYETERETYLIIGTKVDPEAALPPGKVGDGEEVIEVPAALIRGLESK